MKNIFRSKVYFIFMLLLLFCGAEAQTVVEGFIRDAGNNDPLQDIYVMASRLSSKTIFAYTNSNKEGYYSLAFSSDSDSVQIKYSHISYGDTVIVLKNSSQRVDIFMAQQKSMLKGIVIKPKVVERRGDTLIFPVSSYVTAQDLSIGDVIRKLPGIEVNSSGSISYLGKTINEFTIESLDLMGGRYGGIVNNLKHDHVSTIEIIESNERIKVLKEISESDQAGINLKLKENSKNRYLLNFSVAAGYQNSLLWDGEFSLMQFASKKQTNIIYKANNIGRALIAELQPFYGNPNALYQPRQNISLGTDIPPLSSTDRFLDNNTNSININRLYKTGDNSVLRINADYFNDRNHYAIERNASYMYSVDSIISIEENNNRNSILNRVNISLDFTTNAQNYYLSNNTMYKGAWEKNNAHVLGSVDSDQNLNFNSLFIANNLSFIKSIQRKVIIRVDSDLRYIDQFEKFTILNGVDNSNYLQTIRRNYLYTDNTLSFNSTGKILNWNLLFGASYKNDNLSTKLEIDNQNEDNNKNSLSLDELRIYTQPSIRWTKGKVRLSIRYPIRYHLFNHTNELRTAKGEKRGMILTDPYINLAYGSNTSFYTSVTFNRSHQIGDIFSSADGNMLIGYRNISKSSQLWKRDTVNTLSLYSTINFDEILTKVSFRISANRSSSNTVISQTFEDIMQNRDLLPLPVKTGGMSGSLSIDKNFTGILDKIGINISPLYRNSKQLLSGVLLENRYKSISFGLNLHIFLWRKGDLNYRGTYGISRSDNFRGSNTLGYSLINTMFHKASVKSAIYRELYLKLSFEYGKIFLKQNSIPSTLFIDTELTKKHKKIEFSFAVNNILNSRNYILENVNAFSSSNVIYPLRSRNLLLRVRYLF